MKIILILNLFLFCSFILQAQESDINKLKKLSYAEIDSISNIFKIKGQFQFVIPYMEAARSKAKEAYGTQDSTYALYTLDLGLFYQLSGQFKPSESFLLEAKSIYERLYGKEDPTYSKSLSYLAQLHMTLGNYVDAEPLLLESKLIFEKTIGKEQSQYATVLNNLAVLYKDMGNYAQAELLHLEAKSIRERVLGKEHPHYATSINNLAYMYKSIGKYAEAELLYLEAIEIKSTSLGKNHPEYGQSLNNLALLYNEMGKYDKVEPLLLESKNISEKVLGKEHPKYAQTISNLAGLYLDMEQYSKSEKLFLEAKEIRLKTVGKYHPNYCIALNSLADLYIKMDRYDDAWHYIQLTMESATGLALSLHFTETWEDSVLQANYTSVQHIGRMVRVLHSVFWLLELNGQRRYEQVLISDLVNKLLKKNRAHFSDEQDKLRLLSKSHDWMLRGLRVIDKKNQFEKAFQLVELNKATLVLESTQKAQNNQLGELPDSLVQEEKKLLKRQATIEASLLENRTETEKEKLHSELNSLLIELHKFKEKIELKYPKYAALQYREVDLKTTDIQSTLNSNSALLEYVLADSLVYIFYIDQQQTKILESAIPKNELELKIKLYHDVLSNYTFLLKEPEKSYRIYSELAHWFYNNLVAPALKNQKNINQLIIVSDGKLGHLPFETFLIEQAPQGQQNYAVLHYLLNDYKISYNYSATLWKESKTESNAKKSNNGQILGMAANYNLKLTETAKKWRMPIYQRWREELLPLPSARKEIEILEKEFSGFFAFDEQASEKIFKEKASEYSIIHLAMHGILDSKAPILSSLVFSEDMDSLENNFLQAYEISALNLNADLVVLSACETGYGKFEKGNGIASLARSFIYAGASSLIVSLWQVNDFATTELMKNLYQNLAKGMNKDAALQQAKLDYIKNTAGVAAHPAFWSPFILIGNEDPVNLSNSKSLDFLRSPYLWGITILLFFFVVIWKRKSTKD